MFSYTFVLALLLLFPGFCAWAGVRAGQRTDFLSPSPDLPNSTATVGIVVGGTIGGHITGAVLFTAQAWWCQATTRCVGIGFDPNVYRILLSSTHAGSSIPDAAIAWWLLALGLDGVLTGVAAYHLSRWSWLRDRWDRVSFGWLQPAVQAVKTRNSVVVAYVVTKTAHDGAIIAYEGIVRQLAIDADQRVTMIVLERVDRFLLKVTEAGVIRVNAPQSPIAQIQLRDSEIANVALEIVILPDHS